MTWNKTKVGVSFLFDGIFSISFGMDVQTFKRFLYLTGAFYNQIDLVEGTITGFFTKIWTPLAIFFLSQLWIRQ